MRGIHQVLRGQSVQAAGAYVLKRGPGDLGTPAEKGCLGNRKFPHVRYVMRVERFIILERRRDLGKQHEAREDDQRECGFPRHDPIPKAYSQNRRVGQVVNLRPIVNPPERYIVKIACVARFTK